MFKVTEQTEDLEVTLTMMVSGFSLWVFLGFQRQSSLRLCLVVGRLELSVIDPSHIQLRDILSEIFPALLSLFIDVIHSRINELLVNPAGGFTF